MPTSDPSVSWEALAELHAAAAHAAARIPFPQHRLLDAEQFARLCARSKVAAHLSGDSMLALLEDLHRMRLVVPLLVSPKGSDHRELAHFDGYEPWSTHGSAGDSGGWTELYYHPFQLWLVDVAARNFFTPWSFSPGLRERIAKRRADFSKHAELARREFAIAHEPTVRQREARFYRALPALLLADATVGPAVRRLPPCTELVAHLDAQPPSASRRAQDDAAWLRWSEAALRVRALELVQRDRAKLLEFAREAWTVADGCDPLRHWRDLVPFVRWDELERREGAAFAAHRIKELALLLGELIRRVDGLATAREVYDPDGVAPLRMRLGGEPDPSSALQRTLVAARYGLHPSPAVAWFVEGKSEQRVIAAIDAAQGGELERAGVVVTELSGGDSLKHAALAIDVARPLGTLVFVLADDNDKRIARWARQLVDAGRLRDEQVLWSRPSLEKANFTKDERRAARAECRSAKRSELARWLAERCVVPELAVAEGEWRRPIVEHVRTVLEAARSINAARRAACRDPSRSA